MSQSPPLIVILGPTACGKTRLGVSLARRFNGEIISADSRQVYRGMDIGTGKDLEEYGEIAYHLIDIIDPGSEYNLFQFAQDFGEAWKTIRSQNKNAFLVGGSGLYLDAVIRRYPMHASPPDEALQQQLQQLEDEALRQRLLQLKPNQHNSTDLNDRKRCIRAIEVALAEQQGSPTINWPHRQSLIIGLRAPRELVRKRITARLKQRLQNGMIEEVQALRSQGISWEQLDFFGLEYRYIALYLQGKLNYNDMYQKLNSAIHQFAKKQENWFRNIEKKGHTVHWLDLDDNPEPRTAELVESALGRD